MSAERTAIATVCLSGTLEEKLDAAAAAGFDGVELFENDLVASASSPEDVRARCADLGLAIDLYQPFRDFEAVPEEVLRANLRRAGRKFDVVRRLGADTVLVCSSVSPHAVDDDGLAADQLRRLADLAAEHGVRVAYEALAWGRFVRTYQHSWEVVRRADHPALGVCLDSFHVLSVGSDPAGIRDIPGEKLFFLQLADALDLGMEVLPWSRHHRLFPGQGSFDLTAFLGHVRAAGYTGPLSLEVFNDVFRQSDPARTAVDAVRSLRHLVDPTAPPLLGHAFTEISADGEAGPRLAGALAAMGFAHTGQHRSKPVQLWQQGRARVVVNSAVTGPGASVSGIGLVSTDPVASAAHAEALHAPVLPRARGEGEADLPSVSAPDGTSVLFCDAGAGWLADFLPTGATAVDDHLTGVDHVALTQPFDRFDEATLFHRAVLGVDIDRSTEYAAPYGLVRSRVMSTSDGTARVVLSSSLLRRGDWAPGVPDPQCVAFSTDDVFAAAAALRREGVVVPTYPDNYYEDLDARLGVGPELVARMREHGVLHDRDEHGDCYLLCTEVFGGRVFFAVVQRVGGYAACGEAVAPVRMAAHRRLRLAATSASDA
ncbi:bifunctional sugar phosphate isomerase/epimerase/4-hydroxyphenylpyruvate dioxygenase family protein [Saccharothrix sp. Mg75]|uniref:bifunctional sugar phosphate isomerase/epimerase/4-hydroxyphenylpyruvate dioxygenase family protein n=1 Tax=Saccharothrix sp. Mg75 TaxID=3445357 RepID=UPI003EE85F9B